MPESTVNRKRAIDVVNASLKKRYAREARFRRIGFGAVIMGLLFVSILFIDIIGKGYSAFVQTHIELEVFFDPAVIDPQGTGDMQAIARADFRKIAREPLKALFPEVSGRRDKRKLYSLISSGAPYQLLEMVRDDPGLIGQLQQSIEAAAKGLHHCRRAVAHISDKQRIPGEHRISLRYVAGQGQHKGNAMLGSGNGIAGRGINHNNAPPRCLPHVNIVNPHPGPANYL